MDLMTWKQREKLGHLHRVENESHKKKKKLRVFMAFARYTLISFHW